MLIGDSGAGKTGSLACLAKAGYNLRFVDMDSGLVPLQQLLRDDEKALDRVGYMTFRDKYKSTPAGMSVVHPAKAYLNAAKTMDKWEDETSPSEWGPKYIYIVDSLTLLSKAAFNQAISLSPTTKDPRQWYGAAQSAIENFLACLTSDDFATNVIVISHITDIELNDGTMRGFPSSVGKALSRNIARYFNDLFVVETKGMGSKTRRIIRTVPNGQTDAKASLTDLLPEMPIEDGMLTIFKKLQEQ